MVNYFGDDTDVRPAGDRVTFTIRRWQALASIALMAALSLVLGLIAIDFLAHRNWLGVAFAIVAMIAPVAIAIRVPRLGIYADATGVVVREQLRTHQLRWDEIVEFRGTALDASRVPAPTILLADGRVIRIAAAAPARWESPWRFDHLALELNELMSRVRFGRELRS